MTHARTRFPHSKWVGSQPLRRLATGLLVGLAFALPGCQSQNDLSASAAGNRAPNARFSEGETQGTPGLEVQFTDTSTGEITSRSWDFGAVGTRTEANPLVRIEEITHSDQQQAFELLRRHADKSYSLCDAISFVVIGRLGLRQALSFDDHFRQFGGFQVFS